ncbi:hypothetical protein M2280_006119 [Prescottella agglutinans]|uniref:Uncharacterized protein n=1 Tax=Prescottella agglutinans TaxID=1644129 RepID=A0ABT6MLR9_9NOCA|nr:hypothetical protein [Prescottella agglutinans]
MDYPWIYWLLWPPFFNEEQRLWVVENAPCWLVVENCK